MAPFEKKNSTLQSPNMSLHVMQRKASKFGSFQNYLSCASNQDMDVDLYDLKSLKEVSTPTVKDQSKGTKLQLAIDTAKNRVRESKKSQTFK